MRTIVIAFALLLVSSTCTGDTIVLRNGRQLRGKVVARSRNKIAIKTDAGKLVMIKSDEVAKIAAGEEEPRQAEEPGRATPRGRPPAPAIVNLIPDGGFESPKGELLKQVLEKYKGTRLSLSLDETFCYEGKRSLKIVAPKGKYVFFGMLWPFNNLEIPPGKRMIASFRLHSKTYRGWTYNGLRFFNAGGKELETPLDRVCNDNQRNATEKGLWKKVILEDTVPEGVGSARWMMALHIDGNAHTVWLDDIRVYREPEAFPSAVQAFDFGTPDSEIFMGMTKVTADQEYAPDQRFGWTGSRRGVFLQRTFRDKPYVSPSVRSADIANWPALCSTLGAIYLPPRRRLWDALDPPVQEIVSRAAKTKRIDQPGRAAVLAALNEVLAKRDLYRAKCFPHLAFRLRSALRQKLQERPTSMSDREVQLVNRRILETTLPVDPAKDRFRFPDPLSYDFVYAEDATFRAELRNGTYDVVLVCGSMDAGYWHWYQRVCDAMDYTIPVEGGKSIKDSHPVAAHESEESFISIDPSLPNGEAVWQTHVKPKLREHRLSVTVRTGKLEIAFKRCPVGALLIYRRTHSSRLERELLGAETALMEACNCLDGPGGKEVK